MQTPSASVQSTFLRLRFCQVLAAAGHLPRTLHSSRATVSCGKGAAGSDKLYPSQYSINKEARKPGTNTSTPPGLSGRPGRLPAQAPHRSTRAAFPQVAPRETGSLRPTDRVHRCGWWQGISLQKVAEPGPGHAGTLRASIQPLPPDANHLGAELSDQVAVAGDAVVLGVAPDDARKHRMLTGYAPVPM